MTYSNIHWITDIFIFLYLISALLDSNWISVTSHYVWPFIKNVCGKYRSMNLKLIQLIKVCIWGDGDQLVKCQIIGVSNKPFPFRCKVLINLTNLLKRLKKSSSNLPMFVQFVVFMNIHHFRHISLLCGALLAT